MQKNDYIELELLDWLRSRPELNEVELAIAEAQYLFIVLSGMGESAEFTNLQKLIEWVWSSIHLPLELFEPLLLKELTKSQERD